MVRSEEENQHWMAVGAHRQSGCNAVIKVSVNEARKTRQHQRHGDTVTARVG